MLSQEERDFSVGIYYAACRYKGGDAYLRAQMDALLMFFGLAEVGCRDFLLAQAATGPKRFKSLEGHGWDTLDLLKARHELIKEGKLGTGSSYWLIPEGVTDEDLEAQKRAEAEAKKAESEAKKAARQAEKEAEEQAADEARSKMPVPSIGVADSWTGQPVSEEGLITGRKGRKFTKEGLCVVVPKPLPDDENWLAKKQADMARIMAKYQAMRPMSCDKHIHARIMEILTCYPQYQFYASAIADYLREGRSSVRRVLYHAALNGEVYARPVYGISGFAFQALDAPSE